MRKTVAAVVVLVVGGACAAPAKPAPSGLDPVARVRAYVADFEAWARRYPRDMAFENSEAASREELKMALRHCTSVSVCRRGIAVEDAPHKRGEEILSTTQQGEDRAVIETHGVPDAWAPYFTYTLEKERGDW